jgi:Ca2+-binding RTX toxin-like protein
MTGFAGANGNDSLDGGDGNDDMNGGHQDDYLLNGGNGSDELEGSYGNDSMFGGAGNDDVEGGDGNDWVLGNDGNDDLDGDNGNDFDERRRRQRHAGWRAGQRRADRRRRADVFEFERGDGRDVITDFQNGVDRIELDDFSAAQVRSAISAAQQVGDNLVLALSSDTVIVFKDMEKAQLDMNDFLL